MSLRNRPPQHRPDHSAADSEALAAYVLNALEPEQQSAVRRHLQTCDLCYLEYMSLAMLPGALDTLSLDDIRELTSMERPPSVPARGARPARPRSQRRRASLLAGGAFSAAMVATGFVPAHAADGSRTAAQPGETVHPAETARPGETARPALDAQDANAPDIELTVSATPLPDDAAVTVLEAEVHASRPLRVCVLQVTMADGRAIEACRWEGAPSTRVVFSGDIPLPPSMIRSVEVLADDGSVLAARSLSEG